MPRSGETAPNSAEGFHGFRALALATIASAMGLDNQLSAGSVWLLGEPYGSERALVWKGHLDAHMESLSLPLGHSMLGETIRRDTLCTWKRTAEIPWHYAKDQYVRAAVSAPIPLYGLPCGAIFMDVLRGEGPRKPIDLSPFQLLATQLGASMETLIGLADPEKAQRMSSRLSRPKFAQRMTSLQAILLTGLPIEATGRLVVDADQEGIILRLQTNDSGWPRSRDLRALVDAVGALSSTARIAAIPGGIELIEPEHPDHS